MKTCFVVLIGFVALTHQPADATSPIPPDATLTNYVDARFTEFLSIAPDRRAELEALAETIQSRRGGGRIVFVNFICTHNSRRSHLAQIWTAVAAKRYGIDDLKTFSGGTEATALNPRVIATLLRSGIQVKPIDGGVSTNPKYRVTYAADAKPLECFSKVYNQSPNPTEAFVAVIVCGDADQKCPIVSGATDRHLIQYDDPKIADGRPDEAKVYDERSAQVAREMLYLVSQIGPKNDAELIQP